MTMSIFGQANISSLTNSEVSDMVIEKLGKEKIYKSVRTYQIDKHFFSGYGDFSCRKIVLQRSNISCAFECARAFFKSLFKNQPSYGTPCNENRILEFFLENQTTEKNKDEIKIAFMNCRTITIFITEDGKYSDIEVSDSAAALVTACATSKKIRNFFTSWKKN